MMREGRNDDDDGVNIRSLSISSIIASYNRLNKYKEVCVCVGRGGKGSGLKLLLL